MQGCPRTEKIDVETNYPTKFFRELTDVLEDGDLRGYRIVDSKSPKLELTMDGVAEFKGHIFANKSFSSKPKGYRNLGIALMIVGGIIATLFFMPNFFFDNYSRNVFLFQNAFFFGFVGIALILIGLAIMRITKKTTIRLEVTMSGESYMARGKLNLSGTESETREVDVFSGVKSIPDLSGDMPPTRDYKYKDEKKLTGSEDEKRERLDVVSDVRIIIEAGPTFSSYFPEEYEKEFDEDFEHLCKKLRKFSAQYRIPAV